MNDKDENEPKTDNLFRFSVWKTNIVLTGLLLLVSLFLVSTKELTSARNPVLIESIIFSGQSEMSRSSEIILSLIALLTMAVSSLVFVYIAWNSVIVEIARCRRISFGQAYALLIIASGVVSAIYRL
jgi:hypothetical protein